MSNRDSRNGDGRYTSGISGNPAGRPTGARSKLNEQFWSDLFDAWQTHGKTAIQQMIQEKPGDFVKVVASQMPKDVRLQKSPIEALSDEELAEQLAFVQQLLNEQKLTGAAGSG